MRPTSNCSVPPQTMPATREAPGPAPSPAPAGRLSSPRHGRALPSWPLLVLALPATVAVWSGWVGIGRPTGFGEVHPLPGNLGLAEPRHRGHLARRCGGLRRLRLARLAVRRRRVGADPLLRPLVGHRITRPGHGRASRLPPAHPGRRQPRAVGHHHRGGLPARAGPRHGRCSRPPASRGCLWPKSARRRAYLSPETKINWGPVGPSCSCRAQGRCSHTAGSTLRSAGGRCPARRRRAASLPALPAGSGTTGLKR
jgi:hypothetical protein